MPRRLEARRISARELEGGNLSLGSLFLDAEARVSRPEGPPERPAEDFRAGVRIHGVIIPTDFKIAWPADVVVVSTLGKDGEALFLRRGEATANARGFVCDGGVTETKTTSCSMATYGGDEGPWSGVIAAVPEGSSSVVFVFYS